MMPIKVVGGLLVVAALGVGATDAARVADARHQMTNVAGSAAGAAAHSIFTTHDETKGRAAADAVAKENAAVITRYHYDPAGATVYVTVSGTAKSLVLHYVDAGLVNNITASARARPG